MTVNLCGKKSVYTTVINSYAPTSGPEHEKVEQFNGDIERAVADNDSKYKITTADFSIEIGTKTKEEDFKSMGAFGIRGRNDKGDCFFLICRGTQTNHKHFRSPPPKKKQKTKQNPP